MIQVATLEDLTEIMKIIRLNNDTFLEVEFPAAQKDIEELVKINDDENRFYKMLESGEMIGCGGFSRQKDTQGVYFLNWLAIHPDFKQKSLGTKLYKFIESEVMRLGARMIMLNAGSDEKNHYFYEKMGFTTSGKIPHYYSKNKDLIWYYKLL